MTLSLPLRRRAQSASLLEPLERVLAGASAGVAGDLLALAAGPLSLLASAAAREGRPAAIVGLLPCPLGAGVEESAARALAHRAAAEAEVVELSAEGPCALGALDLATDLLRRVLAALPGAIARVDAASLESLARGARLDVEGAAARLQAAGVTAVRTGIRAPLAIGPLATLAELEVPVAIDAVFVEQLLAGPRRAVSLVAAPRATGLTLLRGVALARLAGHGPILLRAGAELKGPDGALAFGADALEAELDPPGTLGARTRDYGEAAIRGAQRGLQPPRRRAPEAGRVPRILDEHVPAGLDGAVSLHVVSPEVSP